MNKKRTMPGINIQWPWSQLLLSGEKSVETRTYPIPDKYNGIELALIETPGPNGKKEAGIAEAKIIGTIIFSDSFRYKSKKLWEQDFSRHLVEKNDPLYGYSDTKEKWGWLVASTKRLKKPAAPPKKRGIIFTKQSSFFL